MKTSKVIFLLMLALVLTLSAGCSGKPIPLEEPVEQVPTAAELQASLEDNGSTREVTLYYKDLMGYLVPVNCEIPWEEGIAKATLKQMVSSEENDLQAARLGLLTALPEGLQVDMDIIGQTAKVSLSDECMKCVDAEEENAMVCAIVSALTEFDSIEEVQLLVDGEQVEHLTYGTNVGAPLTRADLNIESVSADTDLNGSSAVQVFFESEASGCMVPVTHGVLQSRCGYCGAGTAEGSERGFRSCGLSPAWRGADFRQTEGRHRHHQHEQRVQAGGRSGGRRRGSSQGAGADLFAVRRRKRSQAASRRRGFPA